MDDGSDRSSLLGRLTRVLSQAAPSDPLPLRLCRAFVTVLDADAGAVSLGAETPGRRLLCATDALAAQFEDLQDVVQQGPSIEALRTTRPVVTRSLAEQRLRWPALTAQAPPTLVLEVVGAFPMRPHGMLVGVLTVLRRSPVTLLVPTGDAAFLADAVGAAITDDLTRHDPDGLFWDDRDRVDQATGMVVAQLGLRPADALAVLRAHAFAQESTISEVSARVLRRELTFNGKGEAP